MMSSKIIITSRSIMLLCNIVDREKEIWDTHYVINYKEKLLVFINHFPSNNTVNQINIMSIVEISENGFNLFNPLLVAITMR